MQTWIVLRSAAIVDFSIKEIIMIFAAKTLQGKKDILKDLKVHGVGSLSGNSYTKKIIGI